MKHYPETFVLPGAVLLLALSAQPLLGQETFSKAYSFTGGWNLEQVPGTRDMIICQTTRYPPQDYGGFRVFRIDSMGTLLSQRDYSTGRLHNVMQGGELSLASSDGGFTFLFRNHPWNGPLKFSARLFHVAADGALMWNRKVEFAAPDQGIDRLLPATGLHEFPDGGYLIGGTRVRHQGGLTHAGPIVIKLDSVGDVLWSKSYDLAEPCGMNRFCTMLPTGGFILGFNAGPSCWGPNTGSYLTKITPSGQSVWSKQLIGLSGTMAACINMADGLLIVSSDSSSYQFVKLDGTGEVDWCKGYNLINASLLRWNFVSAARTSDDGAIITGAILQPNSQMDVLLLKLDASGNIVWKDYFNDSWSEKPANIIEAQDGSLYCLSGASDPQNAFSPGCYYIRKIRSDGYSSCMWDMAPSMIDSPFQVELIDVELPDYQAPMTSQMTYVNDTVVWSHYQSWSVCYMSLNDEVSGERLVSIHPNPFSQSATLDIGREPTDAELQIFNTLSSQVVRRRLTSRQSTIDRTGLPIGLYLFQVVDRGQLIGLGKFVVE